MFLDDIAAHDPSRVAITTPDFSWTYGEFVTRIDALARVLVAAGVGPEQVCAVATRSVADAAVAMAAVLRAGGAFLTLDVDQPRARLDVMARSGQARFLVADADPPVTVPGPTIRLRSAAVSASLPVVTSRMLAYVSHTSGSTGEPNAVLIEHRGLHSYLRFIARDYALGPHTVAVQLAPLGYDASVRDIFAPLVAGGRLVVAPRSTLLRPDAFAELVRSHGVNTILSTTPSFLAAQAGLDLDLVVCSGESLRPFLSAGGRGRVAGRLVNQYGPTECTMTSTRFSVPAEPETAVDLVGTPIEGVTAHILDPDLSRATDIGEVHIGGVGVARGYAGRPALTADRFLPDPFGAPGSRMYRTGDLARARADGTIEFLGRGDRQLKIRGHRVDPAEIEGALLAHPLVSGAVVTADHDAQGRPFLIGHVAGELSEITDVALRAHLAQSLPPHMMPRRFQRVERLPTTRSGKVDRRALSSVDGGR